MRGLKLIRRLLKVVLMLSHLLQMRGLKQSGIGVDIIDLSVASFTDAWIETQGREANRRPPEVASFTDAWIETTLQRRV